MYELVLFDGELYLAKRRKGADNSIFQILAKIIDPSSTNKELIGLDLRDELNNISDRG